MSSEEAPKRKASTAPAHAAKRQKKRKSTLVTTFLAENRKKIRQQETVKHEMANSDYVVIETPKAPLLPTNTVSPQPQLVSQNTVGSRMEIQQLKHQTTQISARLTYTMKKLKSLQNTNPGIAKISELHALVHSVQTAMANLPRQIDRAISASSTLAVVEGRNWRTLPHCLVHGLVIDAVTAERENELAMRLARTPLQFDRRYTEIDSNELLTKYSEALTAEIAASTSSEPAVATLRHAQSLVYTQYKKSMIAATAEQSPERTEGHAQLKAVRALMKLARQEVLKPPAQPAGLSDPLEQMTAVPPSAFELEPT